MKLIMALFWVVFSSFAFASEENKGVVNPAQTQKVNNKNAGVKPVVEPLPCEIARVKAEKEEERGKKTGTWKEPAVKPVTKEALCRRAMYFFFRPEEYLRLACVSGTPPGVQQFLLSSMAAWGCEW